MANFANNNNKRKDQNLQKSLKIVTILANCFGLLPVDGITSDCTKNLKFKWKSLKVVYTVFLLLFGSVRLVANVLYLFHKYSFPAMSE